MSDVSSNSERCGYSAIQAAFRIGCINNAERVNYASGTEMLKCIVMPDEKSAFEWMEEWPEFASAVRRVVFDHRPTPAESEPAEGGRSTRA